MQPYISKRGDSAAHQGYRTAFSLVGRQTCGLRASHQELRLGIKRQPAVEVTAVDGSLLLSPALPLFGQRYRFVQGIGQGTFSQILLCTDTYAVDSENQARCGCEQLVALKVMNLKYRAIGVQELDMIRYLSSLDFTGARLGQVIYAFDFHGHFCIVMKRLGASLLTLRQPRSPHSLLGDAATASLRKLSAQILSSLLFLRRAGVIHADIKPENILSDISPVSDQGRQDISGGRVRMGRLRLIDFGNAMLIENAPLYYDDFEVQSLCYRAPEVLLGLPFDTPIDMWSFGCVLAEMAAGVALFTGEMCNHIMQPYHR
jgi:serine/threonine protein kinase